MFRSVFIALLSLGFALGAHAEKSVIHTADAPLPPEDAAKTMRVPEGFSVSLFAGEPDVKQPIGFCIDDRGRLWVAEAYQYPDHNDKPARDRILIFEDTDNDGRHDKRSVFYEGLNYITGIEVGFGGVWVMSPPYFYFISDADGDDQPDADPELILDGFGNHSNAHNIANGFAWGPDGWLYGTHGRTNWSMIGKPGSPEDERIRFDGGVWRYHPVRKVWEPFSDGTTNPWGIDWDDFGQGFVCNCVNPHLFHVIPGAHYEPWRGRQSSQHAYRRIETISDHRHFVGGGDVRAGIGSEAEDLAGGGHAHCGTMVYLGDNWPAEYRNGVFMNNIHGRRINHDVLERAGSGYTASHGSDLMRSEDPWFMGVTLRYGPDGAVFVSDWSDTGECHSYKNTRRETGRIFKISHGTPEKPNYDLAAMDSWALAQLQLHRNDWWVRHARRNLQERAARGDDLGKAKGALRRMLKEGKYTVPQRLRALWALHVIGALDGELLHSLLAHPNEHLRAWSIRLLCESEEPSAKTLEQFALMAVHDQSPVARLELACSLQRLETGAAWPIAEALATHGEDAADQNLPLMLWYGIEPLVHDDLARFIQLAGATKLPILRSHVARRALALDGEERADALDRVIRLFLENRDPDFQNDVFTGLFDGLEGQRSATMPPSWEEAYAGWKSEGVIPQNAVRLALIFDDPMALKDLKGLAANAEAPAAQRNEALRALLSRRPEGLEPLLFSLLGDTALAAEAVRGLADYEAPQTAAEILFHYPNFGPIAQQNALQTLASRPAWAGALLDTIEAGALPRSDLTAYTARQIQNLGDKALSKRMEDLWGDLRPTSEEKARQIAELKKKLSPESLAAADPARGRLLFQRSCLACHRLYGEGGNAGPDLTGSQRQNLDYLLENILDPSSVVSKDFRLNLIETTTGRVISGFVVSENEKALTIQSLNEQIVIPAGEIRKRSESPVSMMPEGLLQPMSDGEIGDLIAYLSGKTQTPLPEN